jgi:hypothetical protein
MAESLAQPKPMEVTLTSHLCGHLLPTQVIQGDTELDQVQVQDWDEEAYEDEAVEEEEELIRVQQEIERLCQE